MRINHKTIETTSEPAQEPITLAEVKTFLKIDGTSEDALLTSFLVPARLICEKYLNRSLITQTKKLTFDYFEDRDVRLPHLPIQSITSLTTYNADNTATVYDSSNYFKSGEYLVFNDNAVIPSSLRQRAAIEVVYIAGYGDTANDVPASIRQGIIFQLASFYESQCCTNELSPIAQTALNPYRVHARGL